MRQNRCFFTIVRLLLWVLVPWGLGACSDDVQSEYSKHRTYFQYERVMTTDPLKNALDSWGQFCTIQVTPNDQGVHVTFQSLTESKTVTLTASAMYQHYQPPIEGYIVGRSSSTDMTTQQWEYVAYDRVCVVCFKEGHITRPVRLREVGRAECDRCHSIFNLNDRGICLNGKGKLERYHILYNGSNTLTIGNR